MEVLIIFGIVVGFVILTKVRDGIDQLTEWIRQSLNAMVVPVLIIMIVAIYLWIKSKAG